MLPGPRHCSPPRSSTGRFNPSMWEIVSREDDYATRMSPLLIDIVLPRFIE